MRSMKITAVDDPNFVIYNSHFDPNTGSILRVVRKPNRFGSSNNIRSPSPELIDIQITNKCGFGCEYCYQNSLPKEPHGRKNLVKRTLQSLDHIPYQIAIGGGEPTLHPNFLEILQEAKDLGTVPNYTTAGHNISDKLIDITNKTCGGVAITFHAFKGKDWFIDKYKLLRKKLKIQLNIHLIADKNITETLPIIIDLQKEIGEINLILLAYYPNVGRSTMDRVLTKNIYHKYLPDLICKAHDSGIRIAFSEGMLPFFLSRPELPVDTRMATRSEGLYSCYINSEGKMFKSSFDNYSVTIYPKQNRTQKDVEISRKYSNIFGIGAQSLWDQMNVGYSGDPLGDACSTCKLRNRCATPSAYHYFTCAYASHNKEQTK